MLENDELIEQFKKSLTATIKSISKSDTIEVNFVKDSSSIDDEKINLIEPNLKSLKNNLSYLRAEADAKALKVRFHRNEIHKKYVSKNETTNEIFNAIEQSRVEAIGSDIFKGIKLNILNKHDYDLQNSKKDTNNIKEIVKAFRYVSYCELTNYKLSNKIKGIQNNKLIKK